MHGRQLSTLENIIIVSSPDNDEEVNDIVSWAATHDIDVSKVDVGAPITEDHVDKTQTTVGVTVGGDGTFLEGARAFAAHQIPVLGVNAGTLAFLARVNKGDIDAALTEVFRGRASVNTRQQYRATAGDIDTTGINEVFLRKHPPEERYGTKVGTLHLFIDDEYVGEYFGSGLIISTPTGSTGRAYSNGGPIHYPQENRTLQIVPHETISAAVDPIVVSRNADIRVVLEDSFDMDIDGGRQFHELQSGTAVRITGANQPVQAIRTSYDDPFITALVDKLDWGLREVSDDGPRSALTSATADESVDFRTRAVRLAKEAAESAGEPLRELHGQVENVEYKTDKSDIVTEADYQANDIIRTAINSEFPGHAVQSEENDDVEPTDGYAWLIDPLDGTGNFAHGNPNYCVSIALLEDGVPIVGVVYAPEPNDMYHAVSGGGAYQNGRPIEPTTRDQLDESMLLSGYDPDGDFLQAFYQETQGVRRLGSAALHLAYVAAGSADAIWEYDTRPWDMAAGMCLLREAGGQATDQHGDPYELRLDLDGSTRTPLLASNTLLHDQLLARLETADI